jgi:heptosyltransferase-2
VSASPLRGRYLVRNRAWNAWLRVNDLALTLFHRPTVAASPAREPKRIVLAVGGHLGDAVIATALLPRIAAALPGAEIGVLTSSWNRRVLESHPRVRWIHVVDHWRLSRANASIVSRWITTRRTRASALAELRDIGYDAAVDLSPYYPNSARLLWQAGIPTRIGYTSGGDGPLYTHAIPWSMRDHVVAEHDVLLAKLAAGNGQTPERYDLGPIPSAAMTRVEQRLIAGGVRPREYAVVHIGAGHARKEWPVERWISVVRELAASGTTCVLTGAGPSQSALARRIAAAVPGTLDVSDRLDWEEFRAMIASARVVLSVDTVAMHVAGAAGVQCVALMTGMDRPQRWRPLGAPVTLLSAPVPCSPCYLSRGCAHMSCIRNISTDDVVDAARVYLR